MTDPSTQYTFTPLTAASEADPQAMLDEVAAMVGADTVHRLITVMGTLGVIGAQVAPAENAWTLESVFVASDLRGNGIGTWAVRQVLETAAPKGAVVVLHT
ncbi:hypothetical protein GGF32_008922 [Allomyces javanicus]|nr:hypothetical protein GGF32_008922 [Allomyces javanicus]